MVLYIYDELEIHKSKEDVFDVLVFTSYISLIAYFIAIGVFYGIFYSNKALQVGLLEHIYRTYFIYFFVLVLYKKVLPLLRRKKKKR